MLYPSIDKLMKKVDSKYILVTVAAKRARQLQKENDCQLPQTVSHKNVGKALEEVYCDVLTYVPEFVEETLSLEKTHIK